MTTLETVCCIDNCVFEEHVVNKLYQAPLLFNEARKQSGPIRDADNNFRGRRMPSVGVA